MKALLATLPLAVIACSSPATFPAGQWEFTTEVTGEEAGGTAVTSTPIPKDDQTWAQCVSAEQAANPAEILLPRTLENSCKFSKSTFANGKIDVAGECIAGGSFARYQATVQGSFTASSMKVRIVAVQPGAVVMFDPKAGSDLKTFYRVTGRRTGDCPG